MSGERMKGMTPPPGSGLVNNWREGQIDPCPGDLLQFQRCAGTMQERLSRQMLLRCSAVMKTCIFSENGGGVLALTEHQCRGTDVVVQPWTEAWSLKIAQMHCPIGLAESQSSPAQLWGRAITRKRENYETLRAVRMVQR